MAISDVSKEPRFKKEISEAIKGGITDIGENKVQEALVKYRQLTANRYVLDTVKWHLIGHLQTNKARDAVKVFDLIHSVDSIKVAEMIDKEAAKIGKIQDVLVEVNTSGESTKFGVAPDELFNLAKGAEALNNVRLLGLMTMAPVVDDKEDARPYFKRLQQLKAGLDEFLLNAKSYPLTVLSMGMTQDYEVAVEENATMVRIGTAVFEETAN